MNVQQLTTVQKNNAICTIKKSIEELAKEVRDDVNYSEVVGMYCDISNELEKVITNIYEAIVNPDVFTCLNRAIQLLAFEYGEHFAKETVEDKNDLVIGFLKAALSRVGYCDYQEVK